MGSRMQINMDPDPTGEKPFSQNKGRPITLELRYSGSSRDQKIWYAISSVRYAGCVLYYRRNERVRNFVRFVKIYVILGAVISKFECTHETLYNILPYSVIFAITYDFCGHFVFLWH